MAKAGVSPYVGPRPFALEEESLFFGRERESNELLALIIAHPAVLFYSQSGAGKSSLLNARLIPLLKKRGSQILGPARVSGRLSQALDSTGVGNVFTLNAILSIRPDEVGPEKFSGVSWADFMSELPFPPASGPGLQQRVLILDQFEEIFTSNRERWTDRSSFFEDLGAALEKDRRLRVVFAMREEYIARMDPYVAVLPERLRIRFHLERLREKAALEAVEKPLEGTGRRLAPEAANKLVNNLRLIPVTQDDVTRTVVGEFVEPVQLQLVCRALWNALPNELVEIGDDYVKSQGDVDQALASYYEECVQVVAKRCELGEGKLRNWFESALITPQGTRGIAFKGADSTAGLTNKAVLAFQNLYLVRPDVRAGAEWYELTHDRFIAPIISSNEEWRKDRDRGEISISKLEARAKEWVANRQTGLLLSDSELDGVVRWLASADAEDLGASQTLRDLVQASQAVSRDRHEREKTMRTRIERSLVAALVLALLCWLGVEYRSSNEAVVEQLTDKARGVIAGLPQLGLLLGARAIRFAEDALTRPGTTGSEDFLRQAVGRIGGRGFRGGNGAVLSLAISQDNGSVISTNANGTVYRWDLKGSSPTPLPSWPLPERPATKAVAVAGEVVAIGREDGQVMVVGRRVPPELLRGPAQAPISAVALSPEGRWLAASDLEGNISRWDLTVSTPNPILLSAGRKQQRAWLLKISRNGQRVLACCVSDVVTVWSLEQRAPKLLKEQVASAADLSLDGRWLMVADRLGDIRRFDLTPRDVSVPVSQAKDCTETPWRLAAKQAVKDIRISPDNRWLAAVPQDGIPLLWSLPSKQGESPKPFPPLNGHDRPVAALDFSTDGRLLVTADAAADGTLRLWDLTAPDPSSSTVRHRGVEGYATVAYLTPDGHYLAGGNDRGATDVRDLWGPIDKIVNVQADSYRVVGVMLSSDGRWLLRKTERPHAGTASARIDDVPNEITAGLWDLRDGVAPKHQTDLGDIIDVSADGSSVVTAGSGGLSIWTLPQRGQPVRARTMSFPPGAVPPAGRAFLSPLQHYLVATVRNGVCLWDLSHGSKGVFQTTPVNPISVAAFSNDSRWFAAARNNVASAWMISAGGLNRPIELRGHSKEITAIVFPAEGKNGQEMFTASADGTALLFPIDSIRLRNEAENSYLRLEGHRGPIRTVWANKSGRKLVTGSDDGTAILWNLDRINLVPSPVGGYEEGPIVAGIFGREERSFTTVSSDGTVREWSLDRDALKKEVERIAGRRLTPQEQEAYIPKPHFWPRFLHRGG